MASHGKDGETRQGERAGALEGVRVLDLSRFIAGPHCGMLLGDLGADVIKIERPDVGEESRSFAPHQDGESLYFMAVNRNKRSLTLNLKSPNDVARFKDLAENADIVIENFRPGTLERLGLGWDVLHDLNPELILARISGFAPGSAWESRPVFDAVAQAASGLTYLTGLPDSRPVPAGLYVIDYGASVYAVAGILAALHARSNGQGGQQVSVSLYDTGLSYMLTGLMEAQVGNHIERNGGRDRYVAPGSTFKTHDGHWIFVIAGSDEHFPRLAKAMGQPSLVEDERFSTAQARMVNVEAIEQVVAQWVEAHALEAVESELTEHDVLHARVATPTEVLERAKQGQVGRLEYVRTAQGSEFPVQGNPIVLSTTPSGVHSDPPSLGSADPQYEDILASWRTDADADVGRWRAS